jgi:hypothetical protein
MPRFATHPGNNGAIGEQREGVGSPSRHSAHQVHRIRQFVRHAADLAIRVVPKRRHGAVGEENQGVVAARSHCGHQARVAAGARRRGQVGRGIQLALRGAAPAKQVRGLR